MTLPKFYSRQLWLVVLLALAVVLLWVPPQEWDEGRRTVFADAAWVIQGTASWLLESTSRAWLLVVGGALSGANAWAYVSLRKRVIDMESRLRSIEFENLPAPKPVPAGGSGLAAGSATPVPPIAPQPVGASGKTNGAPMVPAVQRPRADHVPEPAEQLAHILTVSERDKWMRVKPALACGPWQVGSVCLTGNVRPENQDYALSFLIGGRQVLVVADGCGGIPHGGRAAHVAAVAAVRSIVGAYGKSAPWYACDPQTIAAQALQDASLRLAQEGARLHLSTPQDGLRTTLIVVIAHGRDVGYAYCGDGGACVVRTSGAVEHFLKPQKAGPDQLNVLAASLGPQMQGEPVLGTLRRDAGDLLMVGTDGVFDRVEESFPRDVLRAAIQFGGDLAMTARLIVEELASKQDEAGFICDDNLTLALAAEGNPPVLAAGFWNGASGPAVKMPA